MYHYSNYNFIVIKTYPLSLLSTPSGGSSWSQLEPAGAGWSQLEPGWSQLEPAGAKL
jgi:hypothetical protein